MSRRRIVMVLCVAMILCVSMMMFAGCGLLGGSGSSGDNGNDSNVSSKPEIKVNYYDVTFVYDGVTLGTYNVKEGTKFGSIGKITNVNSANPKFWIDTTKGEWYADSACTDLFIFNNTINEDITLYLNKGTTDKYNKRALYNKVKEGGKNSDGDYVMVISTAEDVMNKVEVYGDESGISLFGTRFNVNYNMIGGYIAWDWRDDNSISRFMLVDYNDQVWYEVNSFDEHINSFEFASFNSESNSMRYFELATKYVKHINNSIDELAYMVEDAIFPFNMYTYNPVF